MQPSMSLSLLTAAEREHDRVGGHAGGDVAEVRAVGLGAVAAVLLGCCWGDVVWVLGSIEPKGALGGPKASGYACVDPDPTRKQASTHPPIRYSCLMSPLSIAPMICLCVVITCYWSS